MTDLLGTAIALVEDRRVGLPLLLFAVSAALWLLLRPRSAPKRTGRDRPLPRPDRDAFSRAYLALTEGRYSQLLDDAYGRLEGAVRTRTGRGLRELPWRRSAAARLGLRDGRALAGCRHELDRLELWAMRLEAGSLFRPDFWRTPEASRRRLVALLDPLLSRVDRQLALLENAP